VNITRRSLSALLLSGSALAACSTTGQTTAQVVQAVLDGAVTVANGMLNVVPNLKGVPPATAAAITAAAQASMSLAQSLSTSMTQTAGQGVVQQIQADVEAVATAAQPYLANNPQAAAILTDVQLALPILLTAIGLLKGASVSPAQSAAMSRLKLLPKR